MATIKPFKAIRPAVDKVANVSSRSYPEYSGKERKAILHVNPYSFLHILDPGFKYAKKVSGEERFTLVHNRYLEFLEDDIILKDNKESLYLYTIEKDNFSCTGIFCGTSVLDYENNIIKKHEATIQEREELFASYLDTVKFNAEPVLMTYPDNAKISKCIAEVMKTTMTYFFTTIDKVTHKLWAISDKKIIGDLQKEFEQVEALYIADGHHRSASSCLFSKNSQIANPNHNGTEPYNYFMSYLIPESQIRIYEFNRMVKDLNGHTKEEILILLDNYFRIEKKEGEFYKPSKKHHFGMYLDGSFYSLYLRKKVYEFTDELSRLDTHILFKTILKPILGILDLRNDNRIHYGYGKHNIIKMKASIDKGKFAIGFSMTPITIEEIKSIADAGLVMPPKSTYIEPKLRSGLAVYEL